MDEALRRAGLFQGVDADDVEALASEFEIINASRGQVLFHEGDPGDSLAYLFSRISGPILMVWWPMTLVNAANS